MVEVFIYVLLAAIFVEGTTELFVKSLLFDKLREFLFKKSSFLQKLLSCGYCTSVWVAILPAIFLIFKIIKPEIILAPVWFLGLVVVLHRLSNYVHNINDKYFDKFYSKTEKGS